MSEKSKMELIKNYIEQCHLLKGGKVNVDYIKEKIDSYSIDETPSETIIKTYVDGASKRQIQFDFSLLAPFDVLETIHNSKFCDDFMEWLENNNDKGILPNIKGAESITCNRGTLLHSTETTAIYVIPIQFIYLKEV